MASRATGERVREETSYSVPDSLLWEREFWRNKVWQLSRTLKRVEQQLIWTKSFHVLHWGSWPYQTSKFVHVIRLLMIFMKEKKTMNGWILKYVLSAWKSKNQNRFLWKLFENLTIGTVKPCFPYSIDQKWLYLLRKVLKSRYGSP